MTSPGDVLIDAIVDRLADRVADQLFARLRAQPGFGAPLYATARNNPTGARKSFLRGCREKAFPTFKQGRELAADWAEVERWWKAQPVVEAGSDLRAELMASISAPRRGRRG